MHSAKPIQPAEYATFRTELYQFDKTLGREGLKYEVSLDADPTLSPKNLTEKLSRVQAYKDRVVAILNRGILAEAYWKAALSKLDTKFDSAFTQAMITAEVREAKSAEVRKALAEKLAGDKVVEDLFEKKGDYSGHRIAISTHHADAQSFLREVENIYDNLHSTDMNLGRQLKSVMINAKVYDAPEELPASQARRVGETLTVGR